MINLEYIGPAPWRVEIAPGVGAGYLKDANGRTIFRCDCDDKKHNLLRALAELRNIQSEPLPNQELLNEFDELCHKFHTDLKHRKQRTTNDNETPNPSTIEEVKNLNEQFREKLAARKPLLPEKRCMSGNMEVLKAMADSMTESFVRLNTMTENEWLVSENPAEMLKWVMANSPPSNRKLRMFGCACCRLNGTSSDVVDDYEINGVDDPDMPSMSDSNSDFYFAKGWSERETTKIPYSTRANILRDIIGVPSKSLQRAIYDNPGCPLQDIRHPGIACTCEPWMRWQNGTTVYIAKRIYDDFCFEDMPILADALEEAGCVGKRCPHCNGTGKRTVRTKNAALSSINGYSPSTVYDEWRECNQCRSGVIPHPLLEHLRSSNQHYRGCWAIDLILGKE